MLDLPDPYFQLFRQAACTAMLTASAGCWRPVAEYPDGSAAVRQSQLVPPGFHVCLPPLPRILLQPAGRPQWLLDDERAESGGHRLPPHRGRLQPVSEMGCVVYAAWGLLLCQPCNSSWAIASHRIMAVSSQ